MRAPVDDLIVRKTASIAWSDERRPSTTFRVETADGAVRWATAPESMWLETIARRYVEEHGLTLALIVTRLSNRKTTRFAPAPDWQNAEQRRLLEFARKHNVAHPLVWVRRVMTRDRTSTPLPSRRPRAPGKRYYPFFGEYFTVDELVAIANNGLPAGTLWQRLNAFRMPAEEATLERYLERRPRGQSRYNRAA